jgi:translation initiation factor 5
MNNSNDPNYRYKIPTIMARSGGKGQFTRTHLTNLNEISDAIGHPEHLLLKYLAFLFGTSVDIATKGLKGTFSDDKLQEGIFMYLKDFVFCDKCNIPECNLILCPEKEKDLFFKKCSSCGSILPFIANEKNRKTANLILKELQEGVLLELPNKTEETLFKFDRFNAEFDDFF